MKASRMRRALAPVAVLIIVMVALVGVGRAASAAPYGTTKAGLAVIDPGPCTGTAFAKTFGHDFIPGELVTLSRGGTTIGTTNADSQGNFEFDVTVAGVPPGTYVVRATGASGRTASEIVVLQQSNCGHATVTHNNGGGGLAFTGVPALALGGIAAILLVGGVGLIMAGRRRSHVS
jgi:hypothetical protein